MAESLTGAPMTLGVSEAFFCRGGGDSGPGSSVSSYLSMGKRGKK